MVIRPIQPGDSALQISNVYERSWKHAYQNIIPQEYLDSIPQGRWAKGTGKEGMNHLVAVEDGSIIGTACFCKSRWEGYSGYGEIVSLYFLPEYIGKGYGKALLRRAMEELKSLGYRQVLLWVLEENQRARKFYEKCGFALGEAVKKDTIGGKELREVMYLYRIQ